MRTTEEHNAAMTMKLICVCCFTTCGEKWHYFLISAVLFCIGAFLYIRFTLPVFEARSSVLVKDTKKYIQQY